MNACVSQSGGSNSFGMACHEKAAVCASACLGIQSMPDVLALVVAYASVVRFSEGRWRSSLRRLLCTCRNFWASWRALGSGEIEHCPNLILLRGRVDLREFRVYLFLMRKCVVFGSLILSNAEMPFLIPGTPERSLLDDPSMIEFVFPAGRLAALKSAGAELIESHAWMSPKSLFPLSFRLALVLCRYEGNDFGVRFNMPLTWDCTDMSYRLSVGAFIFARVGDSWFDLREYITTILHSDGALVINDVPLLKQYVEVVIATAQPLCLSALVTVQCDVFK